MTNPGFKDTEASIGNRSNNELEWCEIARECISLGEEIGSKLDAVTFHGKLCLENGNITDCIVKTIRGNWCAKSSHFLSQTKKYKSASVLHTSVKNFLNKLLLGRPGKIIKYWNGLSFHPREWGCGRRGLMLLIRCWYPLTERNLVWRCGWEREYSASCWVCCGW